MREWGSNMVKRRDLQGMNLDNNSNKEPKKPSSFKKYFNKKTITIGSIGLLGVGGLFVGTNAQAQEMVKESTNNVSVRVMKTRHSSDFEGKKDLQNNKELKNESSTAMKKITANWTDNSVDEIREEIERQRDDGLDVYVVQWGDTLEVLAEAVGDTVEDIVEVNNISDKHLILTGDLLDGILYEQTSSEKLAEAGSEEEHTDANLEGIDSDDDVDIDGSETVGDDGDIIEGQPDDESESDDFEDTEGLDNEDAKDEEDDESQDYIPEEDLSEQEKDEVIPELEPETLPSFGIDPASTKDIKSLEDDEESADGFVYEGEDPDTPKVEVASDEVKDEPVEVVEVVERSELKTIDVKETIVNDPDLEVGEEVVEEEGSEGVIRQEWTETIMSDGSSEGTDKEESEITPMRERVVRIGSLEDQDGNFVGDTYEEVRYETVEYETEYVEDDELAPGEEVIEQHGQDGTRWYKVKVVEDKHGNVVEESTTNKDFEGEFEDESYEGVDVVNEIIRTGGKIEEGKDYDEIKEEVVQEDVKHEEHIIEVPEGEEFETVDGTKTLEVDEEYVESEGQDDVINLTYDVYYLDGKEVFRHVKQDLTPNFEHDRFENRIVYIGVKK